jgi:hypothetical protein
MTTYISLTKQDSGRQPAIASFKTFSARILAVAKTHEELVSFATQNASEGPFIFGTVAFSVGRKGSRFAAGDCGGWIADGGSDFSARRYYADELQQAL